MSARTKARTATRAPKRLMDHVQERLPRPVRDFLKTVRAQDAFLYSAALAFYGLVSVVPLTIVAMWVISLVLGDQRTHQLAQEMRRLMPRDIGAGEAMERVAELGTRLGVVSVIAALWPATAYGSGLERAFDRLTPGSDKRLEGLKGRGLFFLVLLPILVVGSLAGSLAASEALGTSGMGRVVGYGVALATAFVTTGLALVLVYRIFPPHRLTWKQIGRATLLAAAGISVLSLAFVVIIGVGANFQEHYATSGIAGIVLLALWLFLSNALVLVGYRTALEDRD